MIEYITMASGAAHTAQTASATALTNDLTSGRVKWFNNKAGYGFISTNDCETNEERDIFVHHSEIKVDQTQYKYLVQGEYVEFVVGAITREGAVDVHATSVRGINCGKLMCETRNEVRTYRAAQPQTQQNRPARQAQQTQGQAQAQQTQAHQSQGQAHAQQVQKQQRPPRQASQAQGQAQQHHAQQNRPQLAPEDQSEWMVVPRRRTETVTAKPKNSQPRQRQPEIEIAA